MNTVKIVFGFVEVALALKYLSNADLVAHWGLLRREVFVTIWVLIDACLVLYLFGVVKFSYDPPPPKLGRGRIWTALVFALFGLYLAPALTHTKYARLKLLSGILPPLSYSIYPDHSPHLINDYEGALALAKKEHKPIMIDFTGWACANCRRMEENVWPDPRVVELLKERFILVSLYVDDRKSLPEDQQFLFTTADGSKKPIKTIGDKYATLQAENFQSASQPLYAIIDPDERLLVNPVAYTPDPAEYAAWLQCGLDAYERSGK
jgi:thiol:disulfide interchange protein DsbD